MALGTGEIVMIGLGIADDSPPQDGESEPESRQPALVDGVHLRWAFRRDLGFPWYGFCLFRREHRERDRSCVSPLLPKEPGPLRSTSLTTHAGIFTSDKPLLLTRDFYAFSTELDLRDRQGLVFTMVPSMLASSVKVSIGYRARSATGPDERVR